MDKKKKAHGVQLLLRMVVRDPDGKILTDTGRKPSSSFVIQFLEAIGAIFDGLITNATATDGTEDTIYKANWPCNYSLSVDAGINVGDYGIQVGTGDTAEANTDRKLDVQLTQGVGAGNITHGAVTVGITAVVSTNVDLEIKRAFTNNTGSTITVKEAGMATMADIDGGEYHLLFRDVLVVQVVVPSGCSLAVYYTVRTTV